MGDTATHALAAEQVIRVMRPIQEEEYVFLELGNWLTDTSQANDPYAFMKLKATIRAEYSGFLHRWLRVREQLVEPTLAELVGSLARPGSIPKVLRELVFISGWERFRRRGVDIGRYRRLFERYYTQYYPHEHLDFPPWPEGALLGERAATTFLVHDCGQSPIRSGRGANESAGSRRVLSYLDDQIVYVAESLTAIERDWVALRRRSDYDALRSERAEVLARLGHALHAVEDFYFHSNFVEFAWRQEAAALPESTPRRERVYRRRLRAPVAAGRAYSTRASDPAEAVFTGAFGGTDLYHSLADAAETMFAGVGANSGGLGALKQLVADSRVRRDPEQRKRLMGVYREFAARLVRRDSAARAVLRSLPIDRHSRVPLFRAIYWDHNSFLTLKPISPQWMEPFEDHNLGPFAEILKLMVKADEAHEASVARSRALDAAGADGSGAAEATDNGASAERIGSHSLMAKDSRNKQPFYQPALNLASFASAYVGHTLVQRVEALRAAAPPRVRREGPERSTFDEPMPLDWLHLLQHLLCHPSECTSRWHVHALRAAQQGEAVAGLSEHHHHRRRPLPPGRYAERILARTTTRNLEARYDSMARAAERGG